MTFRDTLALALRNLGEAKLRTSLTILGVSIGIASLAGMVSLGVGLQDQFVSRFTKSGLFDTITVTPGQDLPGGLAQIARAGRRGFGARRRAEQAAQGFPRRPTATLRPERRHDQRAWVAGWCEGRIPKSACPGRGEVRRRIGRDARSRRAHDREGRGRVPVHSVWPLLQR